MDRGDRRLERVRAERSRRRAPRSTSAAPFGDLRAVPERAVLLVEQDQVARSRDVRAARRESCSSISASSPIASGFGEQLDQQPSEPDRFAGEIGARQRVAGRRRVAFVEHQIDDVEHRIEPIRQARAADGT